MDLGAGTGLVGQAVRGFCENLVGVDMSTQMLAVAARRRVRERQDRTLDHKNLARSVQDCQNIMRNLEATNHHKPPSQ